MPMSQERCRTTIDASEGGVRLAQSTPKEILSMRILLTSAAILFPVAAQADFTLHILHINDLHSRIEAINGFDSTCSAEDAAENNCFGGMARVKTAINAKRDEIVAAGGNVIVLDAGDQFQGSLYYSTYKSALIAELMNDIGFDAMAVGNHEFDDGPEELAVFADALNAPLVSGNLDLSGSNLLTGKVENHLVLEVGGEKIGIVSALATDTVETSSPGPTVTFQDEIESLRADVQALTDEGVTKIIALTHVGFALDQIIAGEVQGLDAVVGGHSHTLMLAQPEEGQAQYPTPITQGDEAFEVPVVTAYAYSKYLGHLTLTFDDAGMVTEYGGDAMLLDASVEPDAAMAARIAELGGPIEELKNRVVAESSGVIEGSREVCRQMECAMGNLVAEAMLARVADQGVTIAIQNGGGLRASIDAGPVTMGEVLTVLPFQNTLSTFTVTGADIVAALENGVSDLENGAGRFTQVAGLKYTFDPAAAAGSRVSDVMVLVGGDAWAPIDVAAEYNVVSNNYVRGGGDGFEMFVNAKNAYDFGPDLADVVAEYMAGQGAYAPFTDGRITRK
jgi:5'-nucleotidase / UDP-sugar diphosphatase